MNLTILDAEKCLAQDVAIWVQDFRTKSPIDHGEVPVPFEVVQGYIPSYQAGPQIAKTPTLAGQNKAPSIAVRFSHASFIRLKGHATFDIIILTWDDNLNRQGYRDSLNALDAIYRGIYEAGIIRRSFPVLDEPVTCLLVEDPSRDYFPYFVAGLQVHLGVQTPGVNPGRYNPPGDEVIQLQQPAPPGLAAALAEMKFTPNGSGK